MSSPLLATAAIGKTHGTEGFVRIYPFSGECAHLKKLSECTVKMSDGEEKTLHIESSVEKGELFLMKIREYQTPEKARALVKGVLLIPRDKAPTLKKGEYYIADLYGMDVIWNGEKVGRVEYTMEGAQALLLAVRRDDNGKEYIVPNLPVYVRDVSVENNSLCLLNPELLEL